MYFLKEKLKQKIYWFVVNFPLVFVINLAQTINLFYLGSNLKDIARSGYIVAICCMASIKSFYFFNHRELLTSMENELNIDKFQPTDHKGYIIATKTLLAYKMIKRILFILCSFALLGCLARPMFIKGSEQILPMASW
ncbi:unnamed protein product [Psylliodes chrysocephalus]|uniref:Uncharacterized protein n=1 Tax=Psylliodes chrysocephalus TaxID=3402493 RepID=A0A9P0GES9_9CUCU|nr:unnamed protein product [Psylliodes chrysocephala]